jgi:hypothetical protein
MPESARIRRNPGLIITVYVVAELEHLQAETHLLHKSDSVASFVPAWSASFVLHPLPALALGLGHWQITV